jgi:prepilin-type N-terminal cleavage/methylation domain-containing protein
MRRSDGFSLIEVVIALALMLTVCAAVFSVVHSSEDLARVQPEIADMQQRLRVASEAIFKDLIMAGASAHGVGVQPLGALLPAVLPYRLGPVRPDPPGTFKADTLTVMYVPVSSAQAAIAQPVPFGATSLLVNARAGCPIRGTARDPACGLETGMTALVVDAAGAFDRFTIADVHANRVSLEHAGGGLTRAYDVSSVVMPVRTVTYYLRPDTSQLIRYNGAASDAPVADHVTGLAFEYFGEPTSDATDARSLVPLLSGELIDGPWRPDAAAVNGFDADLLRIRRVRVRLRVRGATPRRAIRDLEGGFDVAPRNLNLER